VIDSVQELQKEWPVISGAPWSFVIAVVAAGVLIWLFLWIIHRSQIAGKNSTIEALKTQLEAQVSPLREQISSLKEQIAAIEQRLKLATDAKEEVDKQFHTYKEDVAAKGRDASPAKVEAALEQLNKEDALMAHALKVAQKAIDARARESLPRGTGYPSEEVPGLTLNSNPLDKKR
jgi:small-conductance mechanosensitive channel